MVNCDLYRKIVNTLIYLYAFSIMCERVAMTYFVPVSNYVALPLIILICFKIIFTGKLKERRFCLIILVLWTWILMGMIWASSLETLIPRFGLVTLLMLVTVCIIQHGLNDDELRGLEIVCFIGGMITAVTLLIEGQNFYGNIMEERLSLGSDNDPNYYAMTLLYAWAIAYQYIYEKNGLKKIVGIVGSITILYAIVMLGSRGAIVACGVTIIGYELYHKHYKLLLLMTIAFIGFMTYLADLFERFSLEMMLETGGAGRTDIWKAGIEMIKDNFLQGVGLQNFEIRYNEYARLSETGYSRGLNRAPHNFIIEIWADLGLIGWLIYSYIYIYAVKRFIKCASNKHISLIIGMAATFIAAFFLSSIAEKTPWFLVAIMMGYELQQCKDNSV